MKQPPLMTDWAAPVDPSNPWRGISAPADGADELAELERRLTAHEAGYVGSYVPLAMTAAAKATIVAGDTNVLAVHCHQTIGGQFIDVSIDLRLSAAMPSPTLPAVPTGLNGTADNANVAFSWNAAADATSYNLKRSLVSGGSYSTIGSPPENSFTDSTVTNGTNYFYVVSAVNGSGESSNSSEFSITVPIPPVAPVALYAFENNVLDTSGYNNNGVNSGATFVAGKIGSQAAQFNGSSTYVTIPKSIGATGTGFTIAMWIKTTDTGGGGQWYGGHGLVDGEQPGAAADFGTALSGSKFALGIGNPDTTVASVKSINDGLWHHIAVTWNMTSGAMKVYVDGILDASGTRPTGTQSAVTDDLHLGGSLPAH